MADLGGRVIIVTGGAHGLGLAFGEDLIARGAKVVVADLDGAGAADAADTLGAAAVSVEADVADLGQCREVAQVAVAAFGRIDGLVNNAGIYSRIPINRGGFDEIDPDEWDRVMTVNVKGAWQMCIAAVPTMKDAGYGKIVNISSGTAFKGPAGRCHYVASKAALLGLTRTLARELGPAGIRVNAVAPGSTQSEDAPDEAAIELRRQAASRRSLGLVERPADVVGTVAFLLSRDSDFVTGQTIVVDGGEFMH